jgi:F-box and leucine-rich repeat protein GRR1
MKVAGCHRLTDDSLIHLVRLCPLILELDLAGVPQLRDTSIYAMWLNSIHLRELKLGKIANLTSDAFPDLPLLYSEQDDEVLSLSNPGWIAYLERAADIAIASPTLSSLDGRRNRALTVDSYIDHGRDRDRRSTPDPNFLRPLAPIFDLLRVIDLTGCTELEDPALACLVNSAPKLRSLTLAKCAKLTDRGMSSVARLGKQLHHLHLGHVEL